MFKVLVRNTFSNLGLQILLSVLGLVTVPLFLATIGDSDYGMLMLALAWLGTIDILRLGIPEALTKIIAEKSREEERSSVAVSSIGVLLVAACLIGLAVAGLAAGFSDFIPTKERNLILVGAASLPARWVNSGLLATLYGLQRYSAANRVTTVTEIISVSFAMFLAHEGFGLWVILLAMESGKLLSASVMIHLLVRADGIEKLNSRLNLDLSTLPRVVQLGKYLALSQLAVVLTYQADRILIGTFLGSSLVAAYTIVMKPFSLVKVVSSIFNSALVPAVSSAQSTDGPRGIEVFIYDISRYGNALSAAAAIGGAILCTPFIRLWVGEEYVHLAWLAELACLFQVIWQSNASIGRVCVGVGVTKIPGILGFGAALLNALATAVLLHPFGLEGAIFATMVVGSFLVPAQYFAVFPLIRVRRKAYLWGVLRSQSPAVLVGVITLPFLETIRGITNWADLLAVFCLLGVSMVISIWAIGLRGSDRELLKGLVRRGS